MAIKIESFDPKGEKTAVAADWLAVDKPAKPGLISQIIKTYLANQRRGLARAKTRGQVTGTTKKVYRQKGTGGARHGSRKAPIYVGGGKAHGPDGRQNYSGKVNKKLFSKALLSLLKEKSDQSCLAVVDYPDLTKTSQAAKYFNQVCFTQKSKFPLLIIDPRQEEKCLTYTRNINNLNVRDVHTVSAYEIVRSDFVLVSSHALPELKNRGGKK